MALSPGSRVGAYEVIAPIGRGGMGEVYRARDLKLQRDVAIKALPQEFQQDRERLARFEREARLLASLNHTNIAAIYGLEEQGARDFSSWSSSKGRRSPNGSRKERFRSTRPFPWRRRSRRAWRLRTTPA